MVRVLYTVYFHSATQGCSAVKDEQWKKALADCYGKDVFDAGFFSGSDDDEPPPPPPFCQRSFPPKPWADI